VLHSFHLAQGKPPFHSAPLWLSHRAIRNSKPKREAPFHPPQFATLHSVTTLAFPYPIRGMSCDNGYPEKPKAPKFSKRPNGVSEIKKYGRIGEHVLENAGFGA